MNEISGQVLVIGVDAGGTRSRAYLAADAPDGPVLGTGSGGPGNAMNVGRAELTRHLAAAVGQAVPAALRGRVAAAFGGFAGAAPGVGPERGRGLALSCLEDALAVNGITEAVVGTGGDTEIALAAAPGAPEDGLVLIAGTGAIATRLTAGRRTAVADGHGWLLGDEGSGYWLGARAVRAALEALDGRGPWTSLVGKVAAHYLPERYPPRVPVPDGRTAGASAADPHDAAAPREDLPPTGPVPRGAGRPPGPSWGFRQRNELGEAIVTRAYGQAPPLLARLSPAVVGAAAEGDPVAARLLDEAAGLLAASVRALTPHAGEPLVMTGGLLGPGGPLLDRVAGRLAALDLRIFPVAEAAAGAAALARRLLHGQS